jgi:putative MATE family efflux protein
MIYAVSAGFSVQVAHEIGAENDMGARHVVKHGLWSALVVSGLSCLIGVLLSKPLPGWLGGEEILHRDASLYFLVFALMLPFMQLNALTSSYLQCCGDMVTPSVLNAVMCVLDVGFNMIFIPRYGVLGAGIGTGLACAVISLIMAWFCCFKNPRLRLRRTEKTRLNKDILRKAFQIGMPVAVQEIAMCAANVAATMIIAPLGAVAIAANAFAVTAESLCYMPGYGIGSAATTVVGRSIGAGEMKIAKRYGNICTVMGVLFMSCTGLVMMVLCPFVFKMLTPDPAVQALSVEVLRIELLAEPLFAVSIVAAGALRGTGDTLVPSLMNLGSIWVVRIGLALLLVGPLGLHGMWIAMAVELCIRGLLMLYRHGTSKYYKVKPQKTADVSA